MGTAGLRIHNQCALIAQTAALIMMLISSAACSAQIEKRSLNIYTYHDKPPYFSNYEYSRSPDNLKTNTERLLHPAGLYPAFVQSLNKQQNKWQLKLHYLPRKRLQLRLDQSTLKGAVIGVSPAWFGDKDEAKFLWSAPFMPDKDVIVVRYGQSRPYHSLEDLRGLTFALPRGWYFFGISEQISEGKIKGFNTSSDIQNLKLIHQHRADATVISLPTLRHFESKLFPRNSFDVLEPPHDEFNRRVLFPQQFKEAYDDLAPIIELVPQTASWRSELEAINTPAKVQQQPPTATQVNAKSKPATKEHNAQEKSESATP